MTLPGLSPFLLVTAIMLTGCGESYVVVELHSRPAMVPATQVRITARDDSGEQASRMFPLPAPDSGQAEFPKTVVVATKGRNGPITIAADAFDRNGLLVGLSAPVNTESDRLTLMLEPADVMANATVEGLQQTSTFFDESTARSVSATATGEFVIVWESEGQPMVRMFGPDARPLATSSGSNGEQPLAEMSFRSLAFNPSVLTGPDGFLALWLESLEPGFEGALMVRHFTRDHLTGSGFEQPTQQAATTVLSATGIALASGNHVAIWEEETDTSGLQLRARTLSPLGATQGQPFDLGATVPPSAAAMLPQCASLTGGGFACVWQDSDDLASSIIVRAFDDAGAARSQELTLPQPVGMADILPAITATPTGGFVVVWQRIPIELDRGHILLQRFDSASAQLGTELTIATLTSFENASPDVAIRPRDGAIAVIWSDGESAAGTLDVYMRVLHPDGSPASDVLPVATTTDANQRNPSIVAHGTEAAFIAVWTDESDKLPDQSGPGVRMRMLYHDFLP